MKNLILLFFLAISISTYAQFNRDPYQDSDDGSFHLRNGKVYFQKTYNMPVSFQVLEQKLKSYNTTNAGFQIKKVTDEALNGLLLNHHINWNYAQLKSKKIPTFLKNPINATYVVEKNGSAYQVTVENVWFSNVTNPKNQNHITLESIVTGKAGVVFTKKKRTLRALRMIDENLQEIFSVQGSTKDVRF